MFKFNCVMFKFNCVMFEQFEIAVFVNHAFCLSSLLLQLFLRDNCSRLSIIYGPPEQNVFNF